ncbi:vWA domain-containing protein [Roseinatronobacter sp.]|uniref:vWA domain-containing protein n=1 Tax=Roseinatronobacter sp. TaxID=1945755 RepID=UPI003F6E9D9A
MTRDLTLNRPSRATRFAARDPGPAARLSGFMAHLRGAGFHLGVAETGLAMKALTTLDNLAPETVCRALKAVCASDADQSARFDDVFNAFWLNNGRVRARVTQSRSTGTDRQRAGRTGDGMATGAGKAHAPDDGQDSGASESGGTGRLMATGVANLMRRDLRELVSPDDIRHAETIAARLGAAIRDRRSRRRRAHRRGRGVDLRCTLRTALSTGGEPLHLHRRTRPDRPVKLVVLCDVSGSMLAYTRPYLAFITGLTRADPTADAYLFHTGLVRITTALHDDDPLRMLNRLSLLAEGVGGGSRIGANLDLFARSYARRFVNGRSVVVILSDGYDSASPDQLGTALAQLKKRGCRIIWLNPLKGWRDYAPVAGGMAAALPHLDLFAPATTLADLARLEPELAHL